MNSFEAGLFSWFFRDPLKATVRRKFGLRFQTFTPSKAWTLFLAYLCGLFTEPRLMNLLMASLKDKWAFCPAMRELLEHGWKLAPGCRHTFLNIDKDHHRYQNLFEYYPEGTGVPISPRSVLGRKIEKGEVPWSDLQCRSRIRAISLKMLSVTE